MAPNVGLGTEGPVQRGWDLWISSVVMVIIAAIFVGARFTQRVLKRSVGIDDWTILASLLMSIILSVTEIEAVVHGYGAHYKTIPTDQAVIARKWFYGAQIMYKIVLMLNKMAFCFMYYRIFSVSSKTFRVCCHLVMALIVSSGAAFIIGTVFQCSPISAFWDKTITNYWCFNQTPWWMTYAIVQILTDVILLCLPIREVLRLKMSKLEKAGLILVFCTGLFVTFTSIFRATTLAKSASDPDPTWGPIPATVWAVIEANSGIIAACLPVLRQPFVMIFGRFFPSRMGTSQNRNGSYRLDSRTGGRMPHGQFSGVKNSQVECDITQFDRESQEEIIKGGKEGIYVTNDVSVTSTLRKEDSRDYHM